MNNFELEIEEDMSELTLNKSSIIRTVVILNSSKQELSLTFMMDPSSSTINLIQELSQHGIVVDQDAHLHLYFKKSLLTTTHRRSVESKMSIDPFDFEIEKSSNSFQINAPSSNSKCSSALIITKQHFYKSFSTLLKETHSTEIDYQYRLEFHLQNDAWHTNLKIALQNDNISLFICTLNQLNIPLKELEGLYQTVSPNFTHYVQQKQKQKMEIVTFSGLSVTTDFNDHVRCIVIQCVEEIIANDNVVYLDALLNESNTFRLISNSNEYINLISFYLILSLTNQSKECFKSLMDIWLNNICDSFDEHNIFQTYMQSVAQYNLKNAKQNNFIEWISAIIGPSMLSELSFEQEWKQHHMVGRRKRYECAKQLLCKQLSDNIDLVRIILSLDGYVKGFYK